MKTLNLLRQFIFTPTCFICGSTLNFNKELPFVCEKCMPYINFLKVNICSVCNKPRDIASKVPFCPYCNKNKYPFENFVAPFYYENAIKLSIHDYKFAQKHSNAKTYAYFMAVRIKYLENINPQVIVPAPSSKKRLRKRGFNHTKLICRYLSKYLNIPVDDILVKIKHTPPQSTLTQKERLSNLKDAFICKENDYTDVLLFDDIYTTGSTVKELCKTLKKSGVKRITVVTVAINDI